MTPCKYHPLELKVTFRANQDRVTRIINTTDDAYLQIIEVFDSNTIDLKEEFVVLYMNSANAVLGIYKLSSGGITGTKVDIRILLSIALKILATAVVIAHNHPSGRLAPSVADVRLTKKLMKASTLLDIVILDHLIVSRNSYYSMVKKVIKTVEGRQL